MNQILRVTAALIVVWVGPALANDGYFSCVSNSGLMFSSAVGDEVMLTDFRMQTADSAKVTPMTSIAISVYDREFNFRAQPTSTADDSTVYELRTKKTSGLFFQGTLQAKKGQNIGPKEKVVCVVRFIVSDQH